MNIRRSTLWPAETADLASSFKCYLDCFLEKSLRRNFKDRRDAGGGCFFGDPSPPYLNMPYYFL